MDKVTKEINDIYFGAPWVFIDMDLLGRSEDDPELAKRMVPEWQAEGYGKEYNSLIGRARAWCQLRINYVLRKVGLKGAKNAGAKRLSEVGKKCPFWFGCLLDIEHASGGRHAAIFLYWVDDGKRLAATLDGNKRNKLDVNITDISGGYGSDKLVAGPRWPDNWPDGQFIPKEKVLSIYPNLVAKHSGGSTR